MNLKVPALPLLLQVLLCVMVCQVVTGIVMVSVSHSDVSRRLNTALDDYVEQAADQLTVDMGKKLWRYKPDDLRPLLVNYTALPGLVKAAVVNSTGQTVATSETYPNQYPLRSWHKTIKKPIVIIRAPIEAHGADDFSAKTTKTLENQELIATSTHHSTQWQLQLVWDTRAKTIVTDDIRSVLINATVISILCTLGLLFLPLRRLTHHLRQVAVKMMTADPAIGRMPRLAVTGSSEVREIATFFNRYADIADARAAIVNQLVDQRTHEVEQKQRELEVAKRNLEQQLRVVKNKIQYQNEYSASFVHEVIRPLNDMITLLSEAREEATYIRNRKRQDNLLGILDISESAAQSLKLRLNNTLYTAKLNADKQNVDLAWTSIDELLSDIYLLKRPPSNKQHITVHVERIGEDNVYTDREIVKMIIENLIENAYKFTEAGMISARAEITDSHLIMTIRDTGRGIAPEHQAQIFSPFGQIDLSLSRRDQGVGMGLTTVKRNCQLLQGTVRVDSELGCGATFTVTLPRLSPN